MVSGKLKINIYKTRREMGAGAAWHGVERARQVIAQKGQVNIIFAAAPSQFELYESLLASDLDFQKVNAFHMDEYLGLRSDAPQGFGNLLKSHLFSKAIFRSVYYLNGQTDDPQAECRRYKELLEEFPPDIIFHGIGENGHLAFNDPPTADFWDPEVVKIVAMDEVCRNQQVHDGCFSEISQVPKRALTLTIPVLTNKETYLMVTVPGSTKTLAVQHTVRDEISTACPATILRQHPHAMLFLDSEAAAGIL
ncbi:MAG: glucosamine-6-phosphate deaminase [Lachnospiraceae bacterium]|nr:glucosamine-6-phosphate deaminase [Lachnospiraceae bacterium]